MTGGLTKLQKTYKAKVAIAQYLGVVFDSEDTCKLPTADNQVPLGVVWNDEQPRAGKNISVAIDGYSVIKAGATITAGMEVVLKTGGSIMPATSLTAGTQANILGIAENSGIANDLITVRIEKKIRTI